jgi:xanthine/CO dehydrogenase XdhC/CoxF family maturation factor
MKQLKQIANAYQRYKQSGKRSALVTLVHLEGSSYRRPGARMIISEDGMFQGAISGGCLEGDAMRKAMNVITQNRASLVTYDTTDEDDAVLGIGLGCNGIIQVLIEPMNDGLFNQIERAIKDRRVGVLLTKFSLLDKRYEHAGTLNYYHSNHIEDSHFTVVQKVLHQKRNEWIENEDGSISF